jgi:hypothetical protein
MGASATASLEQSEQPRQFSRAPPCIHTSQAAATGAHHRRRRRSSGADATPHPTRTSLRGRKGSQQREERKKRGEERQARAREEGKGGQGGDRSGREAGGGRQGRMRLGPGGGGNGVRCCGGAGTGTTTTLRAQVAELAPTNPSARHAPTQPPGTGAPGSFFFLLPSFGSLGFPPPVRPPRRRLETARDWGKFSRAFRRRRRRRQPIMESDGTGEVAGGIRFGSICQVCALAARAGACDAGSRAAPVRGREDSPC